MSSMFSTALIITGSVLAASVLAASSSLPMQLKVNRQITSRLTNIHLSGSPEAVDVYYGPCSISAPSTSIYVSRRVSSDSNRLIWHIPDSVVSGGCLAAYSVSSGVKVGESEPVALANPDLRKRRINMANDTRFDKNGPWFEGFKYLNGSGETIPGAKQKKIGIVGGGPAGLMTALLLDSVGIKNWEILELSGRVGGRIRTVYLEGGPDDYQYQEMGPMRFPYDYKATELNKTLRIKDHELVFQLADELNKMNGRDSPLHLKFIEFINSNPNIPSPPGQQSLADPEAAEVNANVQGQFVSVENITSIVDDMFKAHSKYIAEGWDHYSEFRYIHDRLGKSLDVTDRASSMANSYWEVMYESAYFSASTFKTVDKGLERIPKAFGPLVKSRVQYHRNVQKLSYSGNKVTLQWKRSLSEKEYQSSTYDYAVIAAPFTQVRKWRLPPLTSKLRRAISRLSYTTSCKIAFQFRSRFWEHLEKRILGGCGSYDTIPGLGSFCYPSYKLNSSGPGVMLASYTFRDEGYRYISLTDEEHVEVILEALEEIHGKVIREQYTGRYNRQCWLKDPGASASWADPSQGQHELYIPAYFETVDNTIFIGEHTSYTHGWIASALESAIRGTVQLCLELGLVDEAKDIVGKWMARWIDV